jgi:hypothetical protein
MVKRKTPRTSSGAVKLAELALAAPQVVAHRLTRMALAGPVLSARDRKEFAGMVREKHVALAQGWMGAWTELVRVNQAMAVSAASSLWLLKSPLSHAQSSAGQMHAALNSIGNKFVEPVRRKAVANAKRLARTRLR